jgi:hypothetical protein
MRGWTIFAGLLALVDVEERSNIFRYGLPIRLTWLTCRIAAERGPGIGRAD